MLLIKSKISQLTHNNLSSIMETLQKIEKIANNDERFTEKDRFNITTLNTIFPNIEKERAEVYKDRIRFDVKTCCRHKSMIYSDKMLNYVADCYEQDNPQFLHMLSYNYWNRIDKYVNEYIYGPRRHFNNQKSEIEQNEYDME